MKAIKWIGWCGMALLVASLMWTTGCGGDGGGTTTVVVTNAPAPLLLPAPQLVTPENNKTNEVFLILIGYPVGFEWTAVPNAQSYVLELNGMEIPVSGTINTQKLDYGEYQWRVWARDTNGTSGAASDTFHFSIVAEPIHI